MSSLRTARPAFVAALLAAAAVSQVPEWTTLPTTSPTMLFAEASIVGVQDALGYHVYSSYTHAFVDLPVPASPAAQFYGCDDHCVVVDGAVAWGFATRDGIWRPQSLNGTVYVQSPNTGANWLTVVVDGNDVHTFAGLLGTWTTVHFASTPMIALGRMAVIMSDTTHTVAVSAHFGEAVELGVPGVTQVDAVGYAGIARTASYFHVFSAQRNRWRTIAASPSATLTKPPSRAGYVIVREANSMNFYSALTDNQVVLFHGPAATLSAQADVAAVQDGNAVFAYSCASGTIDVVTTAATWSVDVQQDLVVANDGSNLYAFGLRAGVFAPALTGGHLVTTSYGAALALSLTNGEYLAFSCLTNEWVQAPPGSWAASFVMYNAVVLADISGTLHGFSVNRGEWTSQPAPVANTYAVHKAAFCAQSGLRLDAFNGRTGRWCTLTTAGPAVLTAFDMSVVADDGQHLHCWSCYRDDWSTTPCVAMQKQLRDECAYGYDGATVHVWSGSSQVSEWANLPEYWRILARGGRLRYVVGGAPGELAFVVLSTQRANLPSPWGTVHVDPSVAVAIPVVIPPAGVDGFGTIVPDSPALSGLVLYAQGLFFSPALGDFYLCDYFESTIL